MKTLLEISLCNSCVNACPYCIAAGTKQVTFSKHMQAEGAGVYLNPVKLFDFVSQMQSAHPEGLVIALTGGEPMCHPAFELILETLRALKKDGNSKLVLYSNLKLLTESRRERIDKCVDYLVAGYHPSQTTYPGNRNETDAQTASEFGKFPRTGREWLKSQLDGLHVDYAVNYVVGAYGNEKLQDFEIWALRNKINYVKTPVNRKLDLEDIHLQLKNAPDMLLIRPDGTIIRCAGNPDVIGSIYEDRYAKNMLCRMNCPLCPAHYCYFGHEHLFYSEGG